MTQRKKQPYLTSLLIVLILIGICLTGVYLLDYTGNDPGAAPTITEPVTATIPAITQTRQQTHAISTTFRTTETPYFLRGSTHITPVSFSHASQSFRSKTSGALLETNR